MIKNKIVLPLILILITALAYATPPLLRWVLLSTDSRDAVREIIRSEVENCEVFSTSQEERKNLQAVMEETYYKMNLDVAAIREKKDMAEREFSEAPAALQEQKRTHESIISKTAQATTKGSQIPAEARSVTFYDERFGNWNKSKIYDESDNYYATTHAYVIQDKQNNT